METGTHHEASTQPDLHPSPHIVNVTVNGRNLRLSHEEVTGLQIKEAAIAQHVPIELSFILQLELPNGHSRIIGDGDSLKVRRGERFTAIANDDNS